MKKLLSTIMALVMLLSLVPMAVAEGGVAAEDAVAQIGDQFYETLADAVDKVANGDTIKLLKNAELSSGLKIGSVDGEQKVLTLDLNGYNISAPNCVITARNANLTVTGTGKIYEKTPYFGAILIKGSQAAEDKDYTVVNIGAGVELEGWSSIFVDQNKGYAYGVVVNVDGAKLAGVKDSTGDNGSAIYVNGSIKDSNNAPKLVLNNVTQAATGAGMYLAGYTDTTITGGSITGGDTGIEIRAGKLTLNDCALEATAEEFSCVPNDNGTTTKGAAIAIAQHTTKLDTAVTINGGSFKGVKALNESNPQKNDAESVKKVSVAVNGGTFNGDISAEDVTGFISAGAFTDLASAVKYATDGATIKLAGDATASGYVEVRHPMTIDLNGHKFTSTGGGFDVYADLMLKNGKVETLGWAAWVQSGAKLVVDTDVAIKATSTVGDQGGITVQNSGSVVTVYGSVEAAGGAAISGIGNKDDGGVTINIEAGAVIKNTNEDGVGIYYPNTAALNIKGGTITGATGVYVKSGKTTITGGTINGVGAKADYEYKGDGCNSTGEALVVDKCNYPGGDPTVEIKGGTFVSKNANAVGSYVGNTATDPLTGFVSGGKFSSDPTAFVTDETLIVVPSTDGTFTVKAAKSEDGKTTIKVSEDGKTVTETTTENEHKDDGETTIDTRTETKTETNVDTGSVKTTETKAVTETKDDVATTVTTVKTTENGKTTTQVTKMAVSSANGEHIKTETERAVDAEGNESMSTKVNANNAPTTEADVKLDAKAADGQTDKTIPSTVVINGGSLDALADNNVKSVIIDTDHATLTLDKTAVKTMESKVEDNGSDKLTLAIKVTEEKAAEEITKIAVEVTATNEAGDNVFPKDTEHTNGVINITVPYTGNATYLDLWYTTTSGSTYMGRFPVVNGFVSFDVKHFSQYDLIPVTSSGSSVIKNGSTSSAASGTHTVTTDLTPGSITKVTVDGKVVDAKYYTINGSNVTFTAEFLKTLKNGSHTVTVENATKIAKGVFTVNNPTDAQSPTTADAGVALYAGMAIASVMGTGVVFTSRKRKNH